MIVNNEGRSPRAADLTDLIATYKTLVEPIANEVIGHIAPPASTGDVITRTADANGGTRRWAT